MKILCVVLIAFMLGGCGAQQGWETVDDPWVEVVAPCREVEMKLPAEAAIPVLHNPDEGKLYVCDGYTVTVQTFEGGDLDATMRQLTGFSRENLTCMQTQEAGVKEYACVWSSVGEGGDYVARAVILDDGNYHYAVSVMADFAAAGELAQTWQGILSSVTLTGTD